MGYRLNSLNEPVLMAVPKPQQTEFDIHHRLESCIVDIGGNLRKSSDACLLGSIGALLSTLLQSRVVYCLKGRHWWDEVYLQFPPFEFSFAF